MPRPNQYMHYRTINYCGILINVFENSRIENVGEDLIGKSSIIYNCTFKGEKVLIGIFDNPFEEVPRPPVPKKAPKAVVYAHTKTQAENLAQKIARESRKVFIKQAGLDISIPL